MSEQDLKCVCFPAGTLRFCENTGQNFSGTNILQSIISPTRGTELQLHLTLLREYLTNI